MKEMMKKKKNSHSNNGALFSYGADVEVSSLSAWYPAQILEPVTAESSTCLVIYRTRFSNNDSEPLVEEITEALLRPVPPADNADKKFDQNEVLEVFNLQGWRTGVIISVLGEKKYRLSLENHVIEVERAQLRSHWNWVNENWTRSPRKVTLIGRTSLPNEDNSDRTSSSMIEKSIADR